MARAAQAEIRRRLSAGESIASITEAPPPIAEQAFALLERGPGELGASGQAIAATN
jgi:hypothetical protein